MYVRGVGPRVAEMLAAKGIQTAEDLLYHLPFRYEDRQNPRSLDELKPGEMASVIAEVRGAALLRTRRMPIFELTVGQGRLALKCIWFNGTYLKDKFHAGQTVAVFGKVEPSRSTSNFKMIQPQFEILPDESDDAETRLLEVGRITPVYESLGGARLASRWQRKVIFNLLEGMRGAVPECLPRAMLARLDLARPRDGAARSALSARRHADGATAGCGDAGASAPDLRRAVLSRTGPGAEAAPHARARRHRLCHHRQGARGDPRGAALSSHRGAEADAGRDRRRHAPAQPHAPPAAGRCRLGQDHRGAAGHAGGHGERLPGGADGAHRDSGHAALSGRAQAAGAVVAQLPRSCC